jgi:hypothetical protein
MIHRSRQAVSARRGHAGLAGLVGAHRCRNARLISLPGRHPCGRSPIGRGCRFRTGVMQVRVLPSVPASRKRSPAVAVGQPPARRTKHPSRTRAAAGMACQSSSQSDPANARDRPVPRQLPDVMTVHRPTRGGADGSTPVSGTGGRRFEILPSRQPRGMAERQGTGLQNRITPVRVRVPRPRTVRLPEGHWPFKPGGEGSNPSRCTSRGVEQLAAREFHTLEVAGSSPATPTNPT